MSEHKLYQTQKANGLDALSSWKLINKARLKDKYLTDHKIEVPTFFVINKSNWSDLTQGTDQSEGPNVSIPVAWGKYLKTGLFARPAPLLPAHGFLDSVRVTSTREIAELYLQVLQADPEGELILMDHLNRSTSSMIITPNAFSVGPDNDGATEGKDSIMLGYPSSKDSWHNLPEDSSIVLESHDPYLEVVQYRKGNSSGYVKPSSIAKSFLVQCRAGEKVEGVSSNFVPHYIEHIQNVVIPTGKETFVEWRKLVYSLDPKVDVVYHAGGGLHSHWGVNTKEAGVTYITRWADDIELESGNSIHPVDYPKAKFTFETHPFNNGYAHALRAFDYPVFSEGIHHRKHKGSSLHEDSVSYREAMSIMLLAFHTHQFQEPTVGSRLLGLGIGYAVRLLGLLSIGEARYGSKHPKQANGEVIARNVIWDRWWSGWGPLAQGRVRRSYLSFKNGHWSGSYGGDKWARIARYQILMDEMAQHLIRKSYNQDWSSTSNLEVAYNTLGSRNRIKQRLLDMFNEVINIGHNCGWVFNKFVTTNMFDHAANLSIDFALMSGSAVEKHREFLKHGWEGDGTGLCVPTASSLTGMQSYTSIGNSRINKKSMVPYCISNDDDPCLIQTDNFGVLKTKVTGHGAAVDVEVSEGHTISMEALASKDKEWAFKVASDDGQAIHTNYLYTAQLDTAVESLAEEKVVSVGTVKNTPFKYLNLHNPDYVISSHHQAGNALKNIKWFGSDIGEPMNFSPVLVCLREGGNLIHMQYHSGPSQFKDSSYSTWDLQHGNLMWSNQKDNRGNHKPSLLETGFANNMDVQSLLNYWQDSSNVTTPYHVVPALGANIGLLHAPKHDALQCLFPAGYVVNSMAGSTTPYLMMVPVNTTKPGDDVGRVTFYPLGFRTIGEFTHPAPMVSNIHGSFSVYRKDLPGIFNCPQPKVTANGTKYLGRMDVNSPAFMPLYNHFNQVKDTQPSMSLKNFYFGSFLAKGIAADPADFDKVKGTVPDVV